LPACATSRTAAGMRQSPKNAVTMRRPPNALPRRPSRYANMPVALVDATALARLVLQTRPHPPTHTKCWGGFNASFDHVGVINYALPYSLPPTLYFYW
jgi:hypothetical protein